jgi:hypothetical protein
MLVPAKLTEVVLTSVELPQFACAFFLLVFDISLVDVLELFETGLATPFVVELVSLLTHSHWYAFLQEVIEILKVINANNVNFFIMNFYNVSVKGRIYFLIYYVQKDEII